MRPRAPRRVFIWRVLWRGAVSATIVACQGTVIVTTHASRADAPHDGSSEGSVSSSPKDASTDIGSSLPQEASDGPLLLPVCDAGPSIRDAARARPESGLPVRGDPPPDCIAPCVWEIMKTCRPSGACTIQEIPSPLPWPGTVSCARENQWWEISSPAHLASNIDVYLGSELCYSFSGKNYSGTVGFDTNSVVMFWKDGAGHLVAIGQGFPATTVYCGPFAFDTFPPPAGAFPPAGSTGQVVDDTQPKCQAWLETGCVSGCCQGSPPALPRVSFAL
jgi:hypothetical protein